MILDADDYSFVPLFRKLKASPIIQSGPLCQVFVFLLLDAAYFDRVVSVPVAYGRKNVMLTKGETFIRTKEVADHLRVSDQTIRRCLHALVERETITLKRIHGGFRVSLVNAETYWDRRAAIELEHSMLPPMNGKCTQPEPRNTTASDDGQAEPVGDVAPHLSPILISAQPQQPQTQGLGASLRIIETTTHMEGTKNSSTRRKKNSENVVLRSGGQLDLIAPDVVPAEHHDDEIEISGFFAAKEEDQWRALQHKGGWIHSLLETYPDVKWVLQELGFYYQWWIENPKKRRANMVASIGNWLRSEKRKLVTRSVKAPGTRYVPAPSEPGKYDGIGVTANTGDD